MKVAQKEEHNNKKGANKAKRLRKMTVTQKEEQSNKKSKRD